MESLEIAIKNALKCEAIAAKVRDSRDSREGHYVVAESTSASEVIFGTLGPMCHEQGWGVFPQQRTGRRLPSIYRKEPIKWGQYFFERPTAELVELWSHPCFNENVALILGPSSGNVIALDIDVKDWDFSDEIEQIAYDVLGHTPWKRIGRAPKKALFYRFATAEELPPSSSHTFVDKDGKSASGHMLEVLSEKRAITIYGRHHDTLARFGWAGSDQPAIASPLDVPLITRERFDAFLEAVQVHRAFHRIAGGTVDLTVDLDKTGPVVKPTIRGGGEWIEENGVVVDGREKFLFHVAKEIVRENAGLAQTDDGQRQLAALVVDEFKRRAKREGRWQNPEREALLKVKGAAGAAKEGRLAPRSRKTTIVDNRKLARPAAPSVMSDGCQGSLAWLPPASARGEIKDVYFSEFRCEDLEFQARQIPATATESSERVKSETDRLIRVWMSGLDDAEGHARTHLVRAPTGAGKTHWAISNVAAAKQAGPEIRKPDAPKKRRYLALVPYYKNVAESHAKAVSMGLNSVEFLGKARCGTLTTEDRCIRHEDVLRLQKSGRSTAGLCSWVNPEDKEDVSFCEHFGKCRYQRQLEEAKEADIVFAVQNYISCNMPSVMNEIDRVIIDETFHKHLVRSARFPANTLLRPRHFVSHLTKQEKEKGLDREAFTAAREECGILVYEDLRAGRDPVRWFLRAEEKRTVEQKTELLDMTISLLSRVLENGEIKPDTKSSAIEKLCRGPERRFLHEEARFWRLLRDRVSLTHGGLVSSEKDGRILWQRGKDAEATGTIRISWISDHNLDDKHVLNLDASGNTALVAKVLGRKESEIVAEEFDEMLRVRSVFVSGRTFSKTSLLPRKGDEEPMIAYKQRLIVDLQKMISHVAAMHPVGGVVVCAPKALREEICRDWACPTRVIWMHFGLTRGLNIAERCDAAIAIGCINPSVQQLDDIVAALAYGEDEPEALQDPFGEYRPHDVSAPKRFFKEATIRLRNGHEMTIQQASAEGFYARTALDQIRREEHLQFLGRLRPIHRDRITTFYNIGSYVPENLIVDEVIEWDDLAAHIGEAVEHARELQAPIGTGETLEEVRAAAKFGKILEAEDIRSRFFQIAGDGEVQFVPAHTPEVLERLVEEGFEVQSGPELDDMPKTDDVKCTFADEVSARDRGLRDAEKAGWRPSTGSRRWGRRGENGEREDLDAAVLARVYNTLGRLAAEPEAPAEDDPLAGIDADFAEN